MRDNSLLRKKRKEAREVERWRGGEVERWRGGEVKSQIKSRSTLLGGERE